MCGSHDWFPLVALTTVSLFAGQAFGQAPTPRPLAPGVLTVIPANAEAGETATGPIGISEIVQGMADLDWTPHYAPESETVHDRAQRVIFRRPVWCLEFAFKPLRMIDVDVPQPSGKMQRKRIWYLVYQVKNNGYDLRPSGEPDKWGQTVFSVEEVNFKTRWFMPHFVLHSHEFGKDYLDRVIPAAQRAIGERERIGGKLNNSVEITQVPIPLSDDRVDRSVWGVATWEDVDPRLDFFSIYVSGLTNAFQLPEPSDTTSASGRRTLTKALQLNFWRPGDAIFEHEREFRYGVPIDADPAVQAKLLEKYGLQRRLDHTWVYR